MSATSPAPPLMQPVVSEKKKLSKEEKKKLSVKK